MKVFIYNILILFFAVVLFSCGGNKGNENPASEINLKEELPDIVKEMNRIEEEDIEAYIKRNNWDMVKTPIGLRYYIYKDTVGDTIKPFHVVELKYTLELINGRKIYSSEEDGNKIFVVDKDNTERGVNECVKLMSVGDKAKIIIPSHLGYGFVGDDKKIPKKATLIYDVEVISVKVKN